MSPFPSDVVQIQELAVEHWMRPVGFRKTIETMYADGVRIFVEVGPRGNLAAFVDDILRGEPHLAVPADVINRSGITQLNHLVGMLAAQGVTMALGHLYARRSPRKLDLDRPDDPEDRSRKSSSQMRLRTGWPAMSISEETAARLRERVQGPIPARRPRVPTTADEGMAIGHQPSEAAQVMSAHLQTMEQFLAVQQEVMQAYLRTTDCRPPTAHAEQESGVAGEMEARRDRAISPSPQYTGMTLSALQPVSSSKSDAAGQPAPGEASPLGAEVIGDMLLQLVSERTGYPVEMLDLNVDLEAELGIDSIKRVEILGSFQQRTGLLQSEDMEALAGCRSLQEVVNLLGTRCGRATDAERRSPPDTSQDVLAPASQTVPSMPFIGTVVSLRPGEELVARRKIDLDEDLLLRDHTLGRQVSVTAPKLRGLPVVPLTVSMEMLAEAAAVLVPVGADGHPPLVEMRDIRAYRWIALEGDRLTLELVARRRPSVSGHEIHVRIREADAAGGSQGAAAVPIIEGTMVFDDAYPEPPVAGEFTLRDERPSKWVPERLYKDLMFHGPAFRGVVSMDRCGEDGAEATLEVLPWQGLFAAEGGRMPLTDFVLLDQPGQVVALWMAEHLEQGCVIFPFRLEALHLYGPPLPPYEGAKCRARIALAGDWQVRSDLDVVRGDGRVWARFVGWEDRRFDLPRSFLRFLLSPRDAVLSEPWPTPVASLPGSGGFQAYRLSKDAFPEGFFTAHGGIWQQVLAHLILSPRERGVWRGLRTPEPRRLEWLLGRMVAKDAARQHLRRSHGLILCPADIEIVPDERGRPVVDGAWSSDVSSAPILSLSHSGGVAAAVAGDGDAAAGVGVDIEHLGRMREGVEELAFTPDEQALLASVADTSQDSWALRLWCAKEAVAKALGWGMVGGPQALVVEELDPETGIVQVGLARDLAWRFPEDDGGRIAAYTTRERDLIVATSLYTREGE